MSSNNTMAMPAHFVEAFQPSTTSSFIEAVNNTQTRNEGFSSAPANYATNSHVGEQLSAAHARFLTRYSAVVNLLDNLGDDHEYLHNQFQDLSANIAHMDLGKEVLKDITEQQAGSPAWVHENLAQEGFKMEGTLQDLYEERNAIKEMLVAAERQIDRCTGQLARLEEWQRGLEELIRGVNTEEPDAAEEVGELVEACRRLRL
ncbi:uncharacterized protein M421DRAFT_10537 [Didymella exigua CBS 183.55]|uniref:Uncharacterized protein n=1 Tax=Didymella exigua CBS 183.55 TaxID=1150837 RepID=A0A6A5R9H4_9PLEO|nr:uncharacterized protein M421DRAFT_10537 [Didymella exigua CBS 183.55]KAF1922487.1 hypothetical protein M421DRAFT_10537 [Didymella exigua CBS 183.55]